MVLSFRHFFSELRRRGVLRAGGVYLAVAWLVLQVLDTAGEPIGLPLWIRSLTVWLAVIGFPLVVVLAWRYDFSLNGIRLTRPVEHVSEEQLRVRKRDLALLGVIGVLLGVLALYLADALREQQARTLQSAQVASRPVPVIAENSIAVLPFENLGGDEQNYLGLGLAEDILHRLASIPGLSVASRTASFELVRSDLSMADIGERLAVRHVLEGSVRRQGDQVRIVAQLIDAQTGYHEWSASFDRRIEDLFRIYDEISGALAAELKLTLAPEAVAVQVPPTTDMQAYDYFLQARSILHRVTRPENAENALRFFDNAVKIDPAFAEAWAGKCQAGLVWYTFEPSPEKVAASEESCHKALALDPALAEAHVALGDWHRTTGEFEAAVADYQQALQFKDNLATAWRGLGMALDDLDVESEAEPALLRATEIDPDDLLNLQELGGFYFDRGRYEDAIATYRRLVTHPAAGAAAYNSLGAALMMAGDAEAASSAFRQVITMAPTATAYSNVGVAYYLSGRYQDSVVMYREAVTLSPEDPFNWMNLGDSLRQTEASGAEAESAYRRAADLLNELVAINPRDAELLSSLAHCSSRLGDDAAAMQHIQRAIQVAPADPYNFYYASLVHLESGRVNEALRAIERAVALNFPTEQLANDPQFAAIRDEPAFQALLRSE